MKICKKKYENEYIYLMKKDPRSKEGNANQPTTKTLGIVRDQNIQWYDEFKKAPIWQYVVILMSCW
jgi:hypothetical protein